jgi:hypothetical protein
VKSLERRDLVLSRGGHGRAGKRLVLPDQGRRVTEEAMDIWETAHTRLAEAIGADAWHDVALVMSRLAAAAQIAASTAASGIADAVVE